MQMQPCNCTSSRSTLARLDAVMSTTDSICFSSFLFFLLSFFLFSKDLISIPTQSFRILSSFFPPRLFFLPLKLLHHPTFAGPSASDGNGSKERDVAAKHQNDREETSCVVSVLPSHISSPLLKVPTMLAWLLPYLISAFSLCVLTASPDLPLFSAAFIFLPVRCVSCMPFASGLIGI